MDSGIRANHPVVSAVLPTTTTTTTTTTMNKTIVWGEGGKTSGWGKEHDNEEKGQTR
jgi:hypothetical protein